MNLDITGIENPFLEHERFFKECDCGGAHKMRALVLHLYNARRHKLDLALLLRSVDDKYLGVAFDCIKWYAIRGENDAVFMRLGRWLADRTIVTAVNKEGMA